MIGCTRGNAIPRPAPSVTRKSMHRPPHWAQGRRAGPQPVIASCISLGTSGRHCRNNIRPLFDVAVVKVESFTVRALRLSAVKFNPQIKTNATLFPRL
jgi:hypothetical protein